MPDSQPLSRCPVCRARLKDDAECRRCGSDLSHVLAAAERAEVLERSAVQQLAAGDLREAQRALQAARKQRRTPASAALLRFVEYRLTSAQPADANPSGAVMTQQELSREGRSTPPPLDISAVDLYG